MCSFVVRSSLSCCLTARSPLNRPALRPALCGIPHRFFAMRPLFSPIWRLPMAHRTVTPSGGRNSLPNLGSVQLISSRYFTSESPSPVIKSTNFAKLKSFFKLTSYGEIFNNLELLITKKDFPNVLCAISGGKPRYFNLPSDLIVQAGKTLSNNGALSALETELLTLMKEQLDLTNQVILDVRPSEKETVFQCVLMASGMQEDSLQEIFEVSSPRTGYLRFAINLKNNG